MNWITSIVSGGVDKVVDSVTNGLDKLFTSDEEKLILKNELSKAMNELTIQLETKAIEHEKEITERWKSDNEHSITRLVRPISYIAVLSLFGFIVLLDGNAGQFSVNPAYIPVIETLLATMTVAYFGSRGVEKTMKHYKAEK